VAKRSAGPAATRLVAHLDHERAAPRGYSLRGVGTTGTLDDDARVEIDPELIT
jgi:hypothetical protein